MEMFSNIPEQFLPAPEHRPQFTFGAPWIQYVYSPKPFNAAYELLDRTIERFGGDRPAVIDETSGLTWTYSQLQGAVNRLGNAFTQLGLQPGERVLIRIPDIPEAAVAQLAVWKVGAVAVPSPVVDRAREVEFIVNDTECSLAIAHADYLEDIEKVRSTCPTLRDVVVVGNAGRDYQSYEQLIANQSETLQPYPSRPVDGSGIYYTGGTTGYPKGCLHTHASEVILADLNGLARDANKSDIFLTHAPIGHAFGNGEKINFPLRVGASVVYAQRPKPRQFLELAERHGVTIMAGAATMYRMMLREVENPRKEFPHLKVKNALSSGEILDETTYDRWHRLFDFPVRNSVGMTPMRHLFLDSNMFGQKVAPGLSVGAPLPGYEARLVNPETGEPAQPGEAGRLAIRGPSGITYWINKHPAIRERANQDVVAGWSYLDDSYLRDDDGWLWFQARLDDMIVTGGRQTAAPEVEAVLANHPAVAEVAVVGVPDELRGQVVKAFVVLRPGYEPDQSMVVKLQDFARTEMATYKYPRIVEFIDQLPKDHVGKIQRRVLREMSVQLKNKASESLAPPTAIQ
jgi:2-aminobenzoate-CoA ligase